MGFSPQRRRGTEYLDAPDVPSALRQRSHRDIALANVVFGGRRALRLALREAASSLPPNCIVLDVGAGIGAGSRWIQRCLAESGITATVVALDIDPALAKASALPALCASATRLPIRSGSVDLVVCSLLLHHFADDALSSALCELNRVAKTAVLVADLRRSWIAAGGLWLCSFLLGFHPVSRHDGVVSVLRGFTANELQQLVSATTGASAQVTRWLGFRITAYWAPR